MNHDSATQRVLFDALFPKPVVAETDLEHSSSDGGALLLKAADEWLGLTASLTACRRERRQLGKRTHERVELVQQRVFAKLRAAFPKARLRVRLDGGFGARAVLDFLDAAGVEYLVGLAGTKPLKQRARRALGTARRRFREQGETVSVFGDTIYKTKTTWPQRPEDVAVRRQLELGVGVDLERLEKRAIDHEGKAVSGSRESLRHVRTAVPVRPCERLVPGAPLDFAWVFGCFGGYIEAGAISITSARSAPILQIQRGRDRLRGGRRH